MTHAAHLKQLRNAATFQTNHADELQSEVQSGQATNYEIRQGFEPGYIAQLVQDLRNDAQRLNQKANELEK